LKPLSLGHVSARLKPCPEDSFASLEDYGLVAVEQDAVFDVPAHGAGQRDAFHIAALFDKVFQRIAVRDARYALLNNRSVIETSVT